MGSAPVTTWPSRPLAAPDDRRRRALRPPPRPPSGRGPGLSTRPPSSHGHGNGCIAPGCRVRRPGGSVTLQLRPPTSVNAAAADANRVGGVFLTQPRNRPSPFTPETHLPGPSPRCSPPAHDTRPTLLRPGGTSGYRGHHGYPCPQGQCPVTERDSRA